MTSRPGAEPVLVTRLGREQRTFPVGRPVRVGRDPSRELVSLSPPVSRQVHGVIVSDARGATCTDQSRPGPRWRGRGGGRRRGGRPGAARHHSAYDSTILVQLAGDEQVSPAGVGTDGQAACSGGRAIRPATSAFFGMRYGRFPEGLDIAMAIALPDEAAVTASPGGLPQSTATATGGCFTYELSAAGLGLAALAAGTYQVQPLGGPDLAPLSAPADLTVGTAATTRPGPAPRRRATPLHHQPAPGTDVHQTPGGSTT